MKGHSPGGGFLQLEAGGDGFLEEMTLCSLWGSSVLGYGHVTAWGQGGGQ